MFIVYGTRSFNSEKGKTTEVFKCGHCNAHIEHVLVRRSTWVTLFFIPIFPVYFQTMIICPHCNYGYKIKSKDIPEGLISYY